MPAALSEFRDDGIAAVRAV